MARPRKKREPAVVDSRALLDEQVAEAQLQADVLDLANRLRFACHHCYDSRLCGPHAGMPDLILVGHGRLIFAELKRQGGYESTRQRGWRFALQAAGAEVYIWRPRDWSNGTIERVLMAHLAA